MSHSSLITTMTFDSIVLAAVAAELNSKLVGGRMDGIHQPLPLDVVLAIRNKGANHMLLVSADARSPRIHLTSIKRPNPKTPPNFCMLLRKHLGGSTFAGAEQVDFDRILHLNFAAYDGERLSLVVEIMGKHSNIILINNVNRILGAVKPIGRQKSRYREVLPGRQYISPPSQNRLSPLDVTRNEFDNLLADTFSAIEGLEAGEIASWLTKTFTGVSPFAARELAARSEGELHRLGDEFEKLFEDVRSDKFSPVLITDDVGRSVGFYPFPTFQHPASNQHERASISTVADMYYASTLPRQAFEQAKEDFIGRIRKQLEARQHTRESIQQGIAECNEAERFKQIGELILSQVASIPEGADSVELVDYYDPSGAAITVKLDPRLGGPENAEAYFRKYRKAVSGAEALRDRLTGTNVGIKLLQKVLDSAGSITLQGQIQALTEVLASHGIEVRRQEKAAVEKRKAEFHGHKVARVVSNGWEILVGQNSEANDYLLAKVARPTDFWLHVKASPSAHVIIRTNGKPDAVPKSVLHAAAELAAQHSDSKHSSLVPVDYTLRKFVRKPKGSSPGKALYQNERTIFVAPRP
ncbi:MAG TPA: NFACT RNA binding domain-containing protein [Armatimonadota bacterium]|nr:NFACT RNA binding domain-containing protein [Armatimonadota bacterium]